MKVANNGVWGAWMIRIVHDINLRRETGCMVMVYECTHVRCVELPIIGGVMYVMLEMLQLLIKLAQNFVLALLLNKHC